MRGSLQNFSRKNNEFGIFGMALDMRIVFSEYKNESGNLLTIKIGSREPSWAGNCPIDGFWEPISNFYLIFGYFRVESNLQGNE